MDCWKLYGVLNHVVDLLYGRVPTRSNWSRHLLTKIRGILLLIIHIIVSGDNQIFCSPKIMLVLYNIMRPAVNGLPIDTMQVKVEAKLHFSHAYLLCLFMITSSLIPASIRARLSVDAQDFALYTLYTGSCPFLYSLVAERFAKHDSLKKNRNYLFIMCHSLYSSS